MLHSTHTVFTSPGFLLFMTGNILLMVSFDGLSLSAFRYIEFYFRVPIYMVAFVIGESAYCNLKVCFIS